MLSPLCLRRKSGKKILFIFLLPPLFFSAPATPTHNMSVRKTKRAFLSGLRLHAFNILRQRRKDLCQKSSLGKGHKQLDQGVSCRQFRAVPFITYQQHNRQGISCISRALNCFIHLATNHLRENIFYATTLYHSSIFMCSCSNLLN